MKSKIAERILAKIPEETKIFVDKYADLVVLINSVLKEKGLTQKALADQLDKRPSEIHKWLSGEHNFTLKSLAKLEAELGVTLIEIPKPHKAEREFTLDNGTTLKVYVNKDSVLNQEIPAQTDWVTADSMEQTYELSHVG
jgi:transcriptional regulator with XRE-family HTH domain